MSPKTTPPVSPADSADSVDATLSLLAKGDYVADRSLATAVFLAMRLNRPLFLEGEAGVGKTEIAKVLAQTLGGSRDALEKEIFSDRFLIRRPLLQALTSDPAGPPILLIDELDRADEPFEAYLLEVLSDYQITIPELGTIKAPAPPVTIITSNRTREIHDALKRRCYYYWVDYPDAERELEILRIKAPDAGKALSRQVVGFVQKLRGMELFKAPGVAETIDWARALVTLDKLVLDPATINDTLGALLKYQDDINRIRGGEAARLLTQVDAELATAS
jgi:MoxR-like ATPase